MKRVKGVIVSILLIVLSIVILLSGCADKTETIEEVNKKNSKANDMGLYAYSVEPFLEQYRNPDGSVSEENKEVYEIYEDSDYVIMFSDEKYEDATSKYDYIVIFANYKNELHTNNENDITSFYVRSILMRKIVLEISKDDINWVKFAFLTNEQKKKIFAEEIGDEYFCYDGANSLWNKTKEESDNIINWKL